MMDFHLSLHTESVERTGLTAPLMVQPFESIRRVLQVMREEESGSVLVCRDGLLVGIFTERDALRILACGADLDSPVEDLMTREPVTLRTQDTVGTAIRKMSFGGFRRLPVVDHVGRPIGLLKASRIVHYLLEHFPKMVYTLPPEPHPMVHEREGA